MTDDQPPLKKLSDDYTHLMSDKTKFIAYNEQLGQKREKTKGIIERLIIANAEHGTSLGRQP